MNRALNVITAVGRTFTNRYNVLAKVRLVRVSHSVFASSFNQPVVTFLDNENSNAHNTMVNDPTYNDSIINPNVHEDCPIITEKQFHSLITQDLSSKKSDEMLDDFLKITVFIEGKDFNLLDTIFDRLRNQLIAVLPEMTDQQLMSVLKLIPRWKVINAKDPVFFQLWSEFDKQCIERYRNWSLNKLLLYMDSWYLMKLSRLSNFVWMGVRKLARKPSRLNSKQLVQLMFYANTSRKFLPTLPMYDIEQEIISYYNEFNTKELGIVSLGFFKSQTPIRSQELVKNMYNTVINDIRNINSLDLAAFLKIFRYCTKHKNADSMYKLMDVLVKKVDEVELVCCTHMAILGTNLLIKHEELLKKISQRIVNEISHARVKDLERITLALVMLNYNPQTTPCIFEKVVNELRNEERSRDFEMYTRCYIFTLSYLAVNNIFPYDCISKALKSETLHKCFGKKLSRFNIPRDIICLNNSVLVECPDYSGSLLPDTLKESCNKHLAWYIPTNTTKSTSYHEKNSEQNFLKLHRELLGLFKSESFLHICYPLPHHPKSVIIFCINTDGKPVTIPETMKNKIAFNDFHKAPELGKWFAAMVLVRNSMLYYTNEYNGLTICKIRQLKKLNYEPLMLTPRELENDNYIQNIILKKLKDHCVTLN